MRESMSPENQTALAILQSIGWEQVQIERVVGGTVNTTFRLSDGRERWYLRIGPNADLVKAGPSWFNGHGLEREQAAINLWSVGHARYFPETVHADFSRSTVESAWVIQTELPGSPWSEHRSRLSFNETRQLWRQLGGLVAELHAYIGEEFGPPQVGFGHRTWSEMVRWDVTGALTDAYYYDLPREPFQQLCDLVDRSIHELDEITQPRLIHSDLGLRHVMIDRDEAGVPFISGLLDAEFARFADAYSESLFVAQALEPQQDPMFDHFLEGYGAERPDRDARVRSLIYQLTALAWSVTDAMRRNRPAEAKDVLEQMRSRLATADQHW